MFLQNPHAADLSMQIEAWIAHSPAAQYGWVVDGCQLESGDWRWLRRHAPPFEPAYAEGPMEALGDAGILLWPGDARRQLWWPQWLARASGRPLLSLAEYRPTPPDSEFWHWLSQLDTEDGACLVLRIADTHALANALPLLQVEQAAALAGRLARWGWIERDGSWTGVALPDAAPGPLPPRLTFSAEQFRQLMRRAQPDMLLPVLAHFDVALPGLAPNRLHQQLQRLAATMDGYGIADTPSQALFVATAFERGDDFHQAPEWQPYWRQTRAGQTWIRMQATDER
ncbi:hypothetical protein HA052_21565 [Chromobacterium haemolyticum]|uniref:DUF4123 domain-containing protein n=1 Tax=Chromobacterium fluminis TaxID=3044269 RepID=A0ABX0LE31_9NEIS|nr:hypothetical protein [Chromobacterium haemolyticum]NHR07782.1 hypothetical protein [Chromobacterium haemolyticum]